VLVGDNGAPDEGESFMRSLGGNWVKTSYNGTIRKNYAGVGYSYDESRDAFIAPRAYNSWTLNEETCRWEAPVPYPTDGLMYEWDETTTDWKAIVND
jgi:hypothetical protein